MYRFMGFSTQNLGLVTITGWEMVYSVFHRKGKARRSFDVGNDMTKILSSRHPSVDAFRLPGPRTLQPRRGRGTSPPSITRKIYWIRLRMWNGPGTDEPTTVPFFVSDSLLAWQVRAFLSSTTMMTRPGADGVLFVSQSCASRALFFVYARAPFLKHPKPPLFPRSK